MILSITGFLLITSFIGFNIIILIDRDKIFSFLEILGLSYLFGVAAISIEMFIIGLLKIKFTTINVLLPWVPLIIFNIPKIPSYISNFSLKIRISPRFSKIEKLIFTLLFFQVIYTFFRALIKPIESYDSVAIWSLKAKILYLAGTLPSDFFSMINATFHGIHPDYPLLVPFSEVWFYTFLNNFNDYLVKVISILNYIAFLIIFYMLLHKSTKNRRVSLFFVFILASIPQLSDYVTIAVADLPISVYIFLSFVYLYMWRRDKKESYFIVSIFSCLSAFWTKNEGALALFILAIILSFIALKDIKGRNRDTTGGRLIIISVLILILPFVSWFAFKAHMHVENDILNIETFKKIDIIGFFKRIAPISYEYQKQIWGFKKWNFIWIVFLYIIFARIKKLYFPFYGYILYPPLSILSIYTLVYFITPQDLSWHLRTTTSRLFLHILPLIVFFIALNANEINNENRRQIL